MAFLSACSGAPAVIDPPLPPQLVSHDELPFGDAVAGQVTRASNAARDRLEPQWGRLQSRVYTLAPADAATMQSAFAQTIPAGWENVPQPDFPAQWGEIRSYRAGKRFFALMLVRVRSGDGDIPVVRLSNAAP
ncbi:hypothetical protein [Sphingobium aromaticiconvertens]|uniref:hypothetical protein n=1 Tax=Sphingobium aromaticiconvertens TaxID=365341 RepID=UPI00301B4408